MPTDTEDTPVAIHLQNQPNLEFCQAVQERDLRTCDKILKSIPPEHIILFLQTQIIKHDNVLQCLFESRHWYNLDLLKILLQYMPPGEPTATFLERQCFLTGIALQETDNREKIATKNDLILTVLGKVPEGHIAKFLHAQPIGKSWYSTKPCTIWLCETKNYAVLEKILDRFPPEDLMPFLNLERISEEGNTYSIFEWLMHHKQAVMLITIVEKIPNEELDLFKTILRWAIINHEAINLTNLFHAIFKKIPDHHKLDLLKDLLPKIMLWEYEPTRDKFFDILKIYKIHKLQTSVEGDSLLILLTKYAYHFLSQDEYNCYVRSIDHLFLYHKETNIPNMNHQNAQGHTALHYAIARSRRNNNTALVTLLLQHRADCSVLQASDQDFIFTQQRACLFSFVLHTDNSYLMTQPAQWSIQEVYIVEKLLAESTLESATTEEVGNKTALLQRKETADWTRYNREKANIKKTLLSSYDAFKASESVCDLIVDYTLPSFHSQKTSSRSLLPK